MPFGSKSVSSTVQSWFDSIFRNPKSLPKVPWIIAERKSLTFKMIFLFNLSSESGKHIEVLKIAVQSRVHTRRKHHPRGQCTVSKTTKRSMGIKFRWQLLVLMKLSLSTLVMILTSISPAVRLLSRKFLMLSLKQRVHQLNAANLV
jgi:hypothetical protein